MKNRYAIALMMCLLIVALVPLTCRCTHAAEESDVHSACCKSTQGHEGHSREASHHDTHSEDPCCNQCAIENIVATLNRTPLPTDTINHIVIGTIETHQPVTNPHRWESTEISFDNTHNRFLSTGFRTVYQPHAPPIG